MKQWFSNFTAGLLFFVFNFLAFPIYLWGTGHRKWSVVVGLIWVGLGIFLYGAFRAIVN